MSVAPLRFEIADLSVTLRDAEVAEQTLYLASEVLRWTPELSDGERRAWALLVIASLENQRAGSTRLPLPLPASEGASKGTGDAAAPLDALLESLGVGPTDRAATSALAARLRSTPALAPLIGEPGDYKPFILDGRHLYHQRVFLLERRLAELLAHRLRQPVAALSGAELERALAAATELGRPISAEQLAAIRAILQRSLTVISGGPGTGKTSIVAAALRALAAIGIPPEEVAIAAATGKAANRLAVSLAAAPTAAPTPAPMPQTLHRLLGYRAGGGGRFRHHENYRLPHRVIIVDESSMVDLALMERLARAARDDARLVLLGDADQLPSVEAGAVFRDLGAVAVTLTESHRMNPAVPEGRVIFAAAQAVLRGSADELTRTIVSRPGDLTFTGVELLATGGGSDAGPAARARSALVVSAFLDRWHREPQDLPAHRELSRRDYTFVDGHPIAEDRADLEALFRADQGRRILCVTRGAGRATGAEAVNAALSRRAHAERQTESSPAPIAPGQPIIMLRNDYGRGLFNGDQGLCLRVVVGSTAGVASRPFDAAVFPHGSDYAAFPLESLRGDLGLAYALTVHRAQGSELEQLALILPDDDLPLLSRELLYTAITRARRAVVIVGGRQILEQGARRRSERWCGLAERLAPIAPR